MSEAKNGMSGVQEGNPLEGDMSQKKAAVRIQAQARGRNIRKRSSRIREDQRNVQDVLLQRGGLQERLPTHPLQEDVAAVRIQSIARGVSGRRLSANVRTQQQKQEVAQKRNARGNRGWKRRKEPKPENGQGEMPTHRGAPESPRGSNSSGEVADSAAVRIQAHVRGNQGRRMSEGIRISEEDRKRISEEDRKQEEGGTSAAGNNLATLRSHLQLFSEATLRSHIDFDIHLLVKFSEVVLQTSQFWTPERQQLQLRFVLRVVTSDRETLPGTAEVQGSANYPISNLQEIRMKLDEELAFKIPEGNWQQATYAQVVLFDTLASESVAVAELLLSEVRDVGVHRCSLHRVVNGQSVLVGNITVTALHVSFSDTFVQLQLAQQRADFLRISHSKLEADVRMAQALQLKAEKEVQKLMETSIGRELDLRSMLDNNTRAKQEVEELRAVTSRHQQDATAAIEERERVEMEVEKLRLSKFAREEQLEEQLVDMAEAKVRVEQELTTLQEALQAMSEELDSVKRSSSTTNSTSTSSGKAKAAIRRTSRTDVSTASNTASSAASASCSSGATPTPPAARSGGSGSSTSSPRPTAEVSNAALRRQSANSNNKEGNSRPSTSTTRRQSSNSSNKAAVSGGSSQHTGRRQSTGSNKTPQHTGRSFRRESGSARRSSMSPRPVAAGGGEAASPAAASIEVWPARASTVQ